MLNFVTVATMLSLNLPPYLNGYRRCGYIYRYLPYSDHAPPCVRCLSLILNSKTVQMYGFIILLQVYLLLHNLMLCA